MSNEPSLIDEVKACWDVVPGSILIFLISLTVAIARAIWGAMHDFSIIDSIGLFSPWFFPWVICIVISFVISSRSDEIDLKEKKYQKARVQAKYGARY